MRMEQRRRFGKGGEAAAEDKDHVERTQQIKVDLSGMSLDSFHDHVPGGLSLGCITKLDLSNNNLEMIPESMTARLLNVVELDVHSNQLTTLPNSIGCLAKLKVLNVSGNLLDCLPQTIENCKSLVELNANFNKLTKLPDTLGFELTNLQKLSVNSNRLPSLPSSTSHMTSLRHLDAHLNNLGSLPDGLENLTGLQTLNVSQNFQHLRFLPPSVGLLLSLVELDISYNSISVLPDSLGCLPTLKKLEARGCPLVSPPLDVVEESVAAVREYLSRRMMSGGGTGEGRRPTWLGKLVKCGTFPSGGGGGGVAAALKAERGGFAYSDYRTIDGLTSPRYNLGMLSPKRLFSSRRSFSAKR